MDEHHGHKGQNSESGFIVLADISGFDAYMVDVELEHAHDVLQELLELIVATIAPPLHVANVRADAVLAYLAEDDLTRGETLLELTEATYTIFRDRLKSIARNNTCNCRACLAIPTLDLKFLVHYGKYTVQPGTNGRIILGGLDADLVRRRLIKDQVDDGSRSYALFTLASLRQMGVEPQGLLRRNGSYPQVGEIDTGSFDLNGRYEAFCAERRAFIIADQADVNVTHDFPTSAAVVWDWVNDPRKRSRWLRWTKWRPGIRPAGRTDIGAVNHCTHGVGVVIETVLDWRPFSYFTVQMEHPNVYKIIATYQFEPLPDGSGTRLFFRVVLDEAPIISLSRPMIKLVLPRIFKGDFKLLEALIRAEEKPPPSIAQDPVEIKEIAG